MSANDLILLVLVAGGAFYAGYLVGRFKALAESAGSRNTADDDEGPLAGPRIGRQADASSSSRPRGAPPPVSAGPDGSSWQNSGQSTGAAPPRRSSKPPPAAAGLMGTGEKSDK